MPSGDDGEIRVGLFRDAVGDPLHRKIAVKTRRAAVTEKKTRLGRRADAAREVGNRIVAWERAESSETKSCEDEAFSAEESSWDLQSLKGMGD